MGRMFLVIVDSYLKWVERHFAHQTQMDCAERLVRTFKNTFRKMEGSGGLNEKLNRFLFTHKITSQSTAGISTV